MTRGEALGFLSGYLAPFGSQDRSMVRAALDALTRPEVATCFCYHERFNSECPTHGKPAPATSEVRRYFVSRYILGLDRKVNATVETVEVVLASDYDAREAAHRREVERLRAAAINYALGSISGGKLAEECGCDADMRHRIRTASNASLERAESAEAALAKAEAKIERVRLWHAKRAWALQFNDNEEIKHALRAVDAPVDK